MPFVLPDHDLACTQVISRLTKDIAQASDPVLSRIKTVPMEGTVASVVETRNDIALDLPAEPVGFELGVTADEVRDGDFQALQMKLLEAADEYAEQLAKMLFGSIDKVTTATGNTIDAKGGPFTFEMFYEMLDMVEWRLDENDELSIPSIVMHPDMVPKLPKQTAQQMRMVEELKARKLEELLARRRSRRLS